MFGLDMLVSQKKRARLNMFLVEVSCDKYRIEHCFRSCIVQCTLNMFLVGVSYCECHIAHASGRYTVRSILYCTWVGSFAYTDDSTVYIHTSEARNLDEARELEID